MGNFKYTQPKNASVSSEELINDLKKVALDNNTDVLPQQLYKKYGKYDLTNISRRYGTWNKALIIAGLKPGNILNYSDEELFENILNIWQHKGNQPVRRDLNLEPSKISQYPYNRRFKSWSEALRCFVEYANENDNIFIKSTESKNITQKSNRDPSLRLRFQVLKRDNFTCVQCGASPAKYQNVELHVDHIKPWSKGGETIYENLQTLCLKCNLGKSNVE
jgi:ribosomal protein L31E